MRGIIKRIRLAEKEVLLRMYGRIGYPYPSGIYDPILDQIWINPDVPAILEVFVYEHELIHQKYHRIPMLLINLLRLIPLFMGFVFLFRRYLERDARKRAIVWKIARKISKTTSWKPFKNEEMS